MRHNSELKEAKSDESDRITNDYNLNNGQDDIGVLSVRISCMKGKSHSSKYVLQNRYENYRA